MARTLPPERAPSSVRAAQFLRADDREQLAASRAELFIVAVALGVSGRYGDEVLFWLRGPWAAERVLALATTDVRQRQAVELRQMLRGCDQVGPFVLVRRSTTSGRHAWALVGTEELVEQLELGGESGGVHVE